ncbi:GNAT family N-acetyltransferase [archaeon]|nr:GNAT family N-acetyltransferase [archaeon]
MIAFFKEKDRTPAVCVTPFTRPKGLPSLLKGSGFKVQEKEAWMFYKKQDNKPEMPESVRIIPVENEEDRKNYITIFRKAYGGATPDEPYGELPPEYCELIIDSFKKESGSNKVLNLIAYHDDKPAGIASVLFSDDYAYIYSIGVVPEKRRKGISSVLTGFCISKAQEKKIENIFLITEHKSTNEKIYEKLGFSTGFISEIFVLDELVYGAKQAVNICVAVKPEEKVVVVTDKKTQSIAKYVIDEIKKVTGNLKIYTIEDYGKRPHKIPDFILKDIADSDAVFIMADYIYGEIPTLYRPINETVENSNARMAAMVELDEELLKIGMNADYEKIRDFSKKIYDIVKDAKEIRVVTSLGTDFTVSLGHRWAILDGFPRPGKWVNLPDGEVLTAPTDINGKIVIDGCAEFLGILESHPLAVELKDGFARKDTVVCSDSGVKEKFKKYVFGSDENSARIGEFAFGTNIFLKKLCGNLTQDEKFPSIHIAFGDPHGSLTGAQWKSNLHMDAIILNPTAYVDGKKIMDNGRYIIQ